jgi:prepilin-type N-terminal cleavage/methylation domain-containing protein
MLNTKKDFTRIPILASLRRIFFKNTMPNLVSGFTIIELLVVVSIIGLLSTIILASLSTSKAKARDAQRIQNVHQLKTAIELYINDMNNPPLPSDCAGPCADNQVTTVTDLSWPLRNYIKKISPDPSGATYLYQYVRGLPTYGYGILMYREILGVYCKTGANMNPAWWNNAPNCPFN